MPLYDNHSYSIVVLGAEAVGKSALILRTVADVFNAEYDPTIEDSFRKDMQLDTGIVR